MAETTEHSRIARIEGQRIVLAELVVDDLGGAVRLELEDGTRVNLVPQHEDGFAPTIVVTAHDREGHPLL